MPDGLQNGQSTPIVAGSRIKLGVDLDAPVYVVTKTKDTPPTLEMRLINRARGYPESLTYDGSKPLELSQYTSGYPSPYSAKIEFNAQTKSFMLTPGSGGPQAQQMYVYTPKGAELDRIIEDNERLLNELGKYEQEIKTVTNFAHDSEYRAFMASSQSEADLQRFFPGQRVGFPGRDGSWGYVTAPGQQFMIDAYAHANEGFLSPADKLKLEKAKAALGTIGESSRIVDGGTPTPMTPAERARAATDYVMGEFQKTNKVYFTEVIPGHHKVGMVEKVGNEYFYTCYNGGDEMPTQVDAAGQYNVAERYKLNVTNDDQLKQFLQSKFDRIVEPRKITDPSVATTITDPVTGKPAPNPAAQITNPAYEQARIDSERFLGAKVQVIKGTPQYRGNCTYNSNEIAVSEILNDQKLTASIRTFSENPNEATLGFHDPAFYNKYGLWRRGDDGELLPENMINHDGLFNENEQLAAKVARRQYDMMNSAYEEISSGIKAQERTLYVHDLRGSTPDILPSPRTTEPVPVQTLQPPVRAATTQPLSEPAGLGTVATVDDASGTAASLKPPPKGLAGWEETPLADTFNAGRVEPAAAPGATLNAVGRGAGYWEQNPARNTFNNFGRSPISVFNPEYHEATQTLGDKMVNGRYIRPMPEGAPIFKNGVTAEEIIANTARTTEGVEETSRISRVAAGTMSKVAPVLESPIVKVGGNVLGAVTTAYTIFDIAGGREALLGQTTDEKLLGNGVVGRTDSGYGNNGMKKASGILAIFPPAGLAASVLTAGAYAAGLRSVGQIATETINVYNKGGEPEDKLRQRWQNFADGFADIELIRQGADCTDPSKYMAANMVEFMKRHPDMSRGGVFKVLADKNMFNELTHAQPNWARIDNFILKTPMNDAIANYAQYAQENSEGLVTAAPLFGDQFVVPGNAKLFYPSGDTAFMLPSKADFNSAKLIQDYTDGYRARLESPLGINMVDKFNFAGNLQSFGDDPKKKEQDRQRDIATGTEQAKQWAITEVTKTDTWLKNSYDQMRGKIDENLNTFAFNLQKAHIDQEKTAREVQEQLRNIDSIPKVGMDQKMIDDLAQSRQQWAKYGEDSAKSYAQYQQKLSDWLKDRIQTHTDNYSKDRDLALKELQTSLASFHFVDESNGNRIGPSAPSVNPGDYLSDTTVIQLNMEELIRQLEAMPTSQQTSQPAPQRTVQSSVPRM